MEIVLFLSITFIVMIIVYISGCSEGRQQEVVRSKEEARLYEEKLQCLSERLLEYEKVSVNKDKTYTEEDIEKLRTLGFKVTDARLEVLKTLYQAEGYITYKELYNKVKAGGEVGCWVLLSVLNKFEDKGVIICYRTEEGIDRVYVISEKYLNGDLEAFKLKDEE